MTYSPYVGRFLEQDPLGLDAGDMNEYRFVGNNPISDTDPSGLKAEPRIKKEGKFDKGKAFFWGWGIEGAIDVVRADNGDFYGTLRGIGSLGQDAKPVEIDKDKFGVGDKIRIGVRSGMDVYIWVELNKGEDVKKYYWRQYVTVKANSKNETIRRLSSPRQLDGGSDKYPNSQCNAKDLSVSMTDRPGPLQKADLLKFLSVMKGDKKVTVALPDDKGRLSKQFVNQVNAVYGASETVLEFKYTTELIYDDGTGKIVKGVWEWGFKVYWKKDGDVYVPIVEPTVGDWKTM